MTFRPTRRGRKDANQPEIVEALRRAGARVYVLERPLDLLIGHRGRLMLAEVKDGRLPPSARALTVAEDKFITEWSGLPVFVIESVEDALALLYSKG